MYIHVSNPSQHLVCTWTTFVYTHLHCLVCMSTKMYHACIAFDPLMCVHVNRQPKPVSTTWTSVSITYLSASASTQVNIVCVHLQDETDVRTCQHCLHAYMSALRPKPHVRTCLHCLRPLRVRTCQSSTQAPCRVDNNLNMCHLLHTCQHRLKPKSTSCVYIDKLVCMSLMYVNASIAFTPCMCTCQSSTNPYAVSTITWILAVHIYTSLSTKTSMDMSAFVHSTLRLMHVHVNSQRRPSVWCQRCHPACMDMYINVSNPIQHLVYIDNLSFRLSCVNVHQKNLWTCTYMSEFVPSILQLVHVYISIVNTMPCQQPECVHTWQHWHQRKS